MLDALFVAQSAMLLSRGVLPECGIVGRFIVSKTRMKDSRIVEITVY